jgi:hypothetical protein
MVSVLATGHMFRVSHPVESMEFLGRQKSAARLPSEGKQSRVPMS